jgi:hypothetical protein
MVDESAAEGVIGMGADVCMRSGPTVDRVWEEDGLCGHVENLGVTFSV